MRENTRARILVTHPARPGHTYETTWGCVRLSLFGQDHPALPGMFASLRDTGKAEYQDAETNGTLHFETRDTMVLV